VQFDPATAGTATGTLNISSNSSQTPSITVSISGTGVIVTHEVALTWNAPSSSSVPITGYHVYRSTGSSSSYSLLTSSEDTQTTYTDSAVQSGQTYSYYVKSVDSAGDESAPSNSTTVSIPSAPHQVNLTWNAPSNSSVPITGYHVYRSTAGGSSYSLLTPSQDTQTNYADSSVQSGQTYSYYVTSVSNTGVESVASNSINVTIP